MDNNKFANIMSVIAGMEQVVYRCNTCNMTGDCSQKCQCGEYMGNKAQVESSILETAKNYVRDHRRPQCRKVGMPMYMMLLLHDFSTGKDGFSGEPCPKLTLSNADKNALQTYAETFIS